MFICWPECAYTLISLLGCSQYFELMLPLYGLQQDVFIHKIATEWIFLSFGIFVCEPERW